IVSGTSAARATWYGLPLSSASSCASSSACFSIKSASLFIRFPRCAALILRHGPLSNAARAATTALSTSGASASATCVITSPVEGLIVGKVFPEALSTHFPLISSFVGPILTFDYITAAAVAILLPSYFCPVPRCLCRGRLPRRASFFFLCRRLPLGRPAQSRLRNHPVGAEQDPSSSANPEHAARGRVYPPRW